MTFQYCFDGSIKKVNNLSVSSPRTWGCFLLLNAFLIICRVFPTHVGVFLKIHDVLHDLLCLPHARGGVSAPLWLPAHPIWSSPRTWGCFQCVVFPAHLTDVFPTHVGVFLFWGKSHHLPTCLPHARGGVSCQERGFIDVWESSPRTWGCFYLKKREEELTQVFPTHVGVFLYDFPIY